MPKRMTLIKIRRTFAGIDGEDMEVQVVKAGTIIYIKPDPELKCGCDKFGILLNKIEVTSLVQFLINHMKLKVNL